ncbi:MAG: prevent-host-death protein [Proteiniphilum sp.]|jgi:antitoxin YefM|uniref:type II toxin-antitoxin system Phd/YefM family antitoxin n=1 Tax=Proteiniphilum sp. TaxID=1926877 RepID=UPI000926AA90|nr:prevent-host-death protein [Proteiniphilum sp.]MEA5128434.1 prevent-host-death protein [Proteiniphilum sp.]OJV90778.1 MAG: prevent-host-death protein [Bacteroidia bacterium 44-10]
MVIVSSREFRDKQKSYLDKVDEGVEILIRRGKNKSYRIIPVEKDDTLMSKEEFFAKIDQALKEVEEGRFTRISGKKELQEFLDSL